MHNKIGNKGLVFVTMGSPEEDLTALSNLESYELRGPHYKLVAFKSKKDADEALLAFQGKDYQTDAEDDGLEDMWKEMML
ncbi:hypothetical protein I3760_04G168700 [Carya illinoinensis]|nr:hypothetical protein I3760_04G168700 [Carya illinoinensis]